MANVIYTARPYLPGQTAVALLGGACRVISEKMVELRDAYVAERRAQRLAYAVRDLDQRLLRDIGLDHSES